MEGGRVFRNHPSVVLRNLFASAFALVVLVAGLFQTEDVMALAWAVLLPVVALCALMVRWWRKTTYTFTDAEILIDIDTLFKRQKHIPYAKLASVGVSRTLFNRMFGTSTLTFNVNSSMNASKAEGTLCLKEDVADRLRDELNGMVFQKRMTVTEDLGQESMVKVSNTDVIIHSLLGQSTKGLMFGMLMLAYSVFGLIVESAGGFLAPFTMFVVSELIPVAKSIAKYHGYRIYRVGDTITVQSGLISNHRSSFKVNKVNSIRLSQPFLARLCGRAMLVGEVVGLAGEDGVPLLCPVKPEAEVRALMSELVPEFSCEAEGTRQPRSALIPMALVNGALSVSVFLLFVGLYGAVEPFLVQEDAAVKLVARVALVGMGAFLPVLLMGLVLLAQSHREFAVGERTCLILRGGYDLSEEYISYDKVQYAVVSSTVLQRAFSLGRCRVHMMSSLGSTSIESGLFASEDLEKVGAKVMSRIEDGSYDHRDCYRRPRMLVAAESV